MAEFKVVVFDAMSADMSRDAGPIRTWLSGLDTKGQHDRKFIVLHKGDNKKSYLVIGPKFVDLKDHPDFYMHKHLRMLALRVLDPKGDDRYQIAGGGLVTFRAGMFSKEWQAEFGGASSDYGVWDYRMLEHRQAVADWLGIRTAFNWHNNTVPTPPKKK